MSAPQNERPDLTRRRPRPAADESVDPVDYRAPATEAPAARPPATGSVENPARVEPQQSTPAAKTTTKPAAKPAGQLTRSPGRPRRDPSVPFSTRLSPEVLELVDRAVANGEGGGVIRNVVEEAIRARWGN